MNEKLGKYESLREYYPEVIHLDQLYRICNISKRSASYLVEHGIIPAEDTGRRTWRYKIKLDDVIVYLRRRDQIGSMIPPGAVSSSSKKKRESHNTFIRLADDIGQEKLMNRFQIILKELPDVITATVASETIGLRKETISRAVRSGKLKHITIGRDCLIPKRFLIEYMASRAYLNAKSNSETFRNMINMAISCE